MGTNSKTAIIYIARHGQTIGNSQRIFLEPEEEHLSDKGKSQAKLLGENLASIKFDKVYSSTFLRARQTVQIVLDNLHNPVECFVHDERLREWEFRKFVGLSYDEAHKVRGEGVPDDYPFKEFVVPGAEPIEEIIARQKTFIEDLLGSISESDTMQTFLIVTHGYFVRILMKYLKLSEEFDIFDYEELLHTTYLSNAGYHKVQITLLTDNKNSNPKIPIIKPLFEFISIHQDRHIQILETNM